MHDGSYRRLLLVTLVLVAPTVLAAPPAPAFATPYSAGGQAITGLAMDPTGEYATAVVEFDRLKVSLPGDPRRDDVYSCHFGNPVTGGAGTGCRGLRHADPAPSGPLDQFVAQTSFPGSGGLQNRFVVAGPDRDLRLFVGPSEAPQWKRVLNTNQQPVDVAIAGDASRIAVATAPTGTGAGAVIVWDATPAYRWEWNLSSAAQPTALAYARHDDLLVVGTTSNLVFLQPGGAKPTQLSQVHPIDTAARVHDVAVSGDGLAAVAGTTQGMWFVRLHANGTPELPTAFLTLPNGASHVAISQNGDRFAAASGSTIHLFRRVNTTTIYEPLGSHDAGATVADLAYDGKGALLVAAAGNRVLGFGPTRTGPVWSFDATQTDAGGLDGPLRFVAVSEDGARVGVAGETKVQAYRTKVAATAAFEEPQDLEVAPGATQRLRVTIENTGSLPDNYSLVPRFPVGWTGTADGSVALAPEERATVNLSVDVPEGQAPGFYAIGLEVRSQALQNSGRTQTTVAGPGLNISVPRSVSLNVTTPETVYKDQLRPGGELTIPVTIRNVGNAQGLVNLSVTQSLTRGGAWDITYERDQVEVPAAGSVNVNMRVRVPEDAASGDRNDLVLRAREGTTVEATAKVTAYVDPRFAVALTSRNATYEFGPGELRSLQITITNTGNTGDTFNITHALTPASVASDWRVTLERSQIEIPRGETVTIATTVRAAVAEPRDASLVLTATSLGSEETIDTTLTLALVARPEDPDDGRSFLPAPGAALVLGLVGLAALARRRLGGRG